MYIIGLTGNSGCGKGTVAEIMKKHGAFIIDCDSIAHINMDIKGVAYDEIVNAFGRGILNSDGSINRGVLGNIVFNDNEMLKLLNNITHKHIINSVNESIALNKDKKCIVIDAPLLIESGLNKLCTYVWAVSAPLATRLERVMKRDNIDREKGLLRFKNQMPFEEIVKYADAVIENRGGIDDLEKAVVYEMKNKELL